MTETDSLDQPIVLTRRQVQGWVNEAVGLGLVAVVWYYTGFWVALIVAVLMRAVGIVGAKRGIR
jgi:hypothetical protein